MRVGLGLAAIATMLAACGGETNGNTETEGASPPFDASSSGTSGTSDGGLTSPAMPDAQASGVGSSSDAHTDAEVAPGELVCVSSREETGCLMGPCTTDADCSHDFLVCAPSDVYINGVPETLDLCRVRYQLPCEVDADCGNGFTCDPEGSAICYEGPPLTCVTFGLCEHEYRLCQSAEACPAGWDCYSPPPQCVGECPPAPKACYPPFASF